MKSVLKSSLGRIFYFFMRDCLWAVQIIQANARSSVFFIFSMETLDFSLDWHLVSNNCVHLCSEYLRESVSFLLSSTSSMHIYFTIYPSSLALIVVIYLITKNAVCSLWSIIKYQVQVIRECLIPRKMLERIVVIF